MRDTLERLTAYLPKFESEPATIETGDWWPTYSDYVEDFFKLVGREFDDKEYAHNDLDELRAHLANDKYIAQASLEECRTFLTFIMRGERFCDGFWRKCIEEGRVKGVLGRLIILNR